MEGCIPQNLWWLCQNNIPQYGWLIGQPSGPQHNQIAPAYSEPIGLVTVDSTSYSFTSIYKISISLGGSSTRPPPIRSLLLDPTGWRPSPRIPSPLRQSIPPSYRAVDATEMCYSLSAILNNLPLSRVCQCNPIGFQVPSENSSLSSVSCPFLRRITPSPLRHSWQLAFDINSLSC